MTSTDAQFEALSSVITALAENPTSEALHYQSLRLSEEAGLPSDELEAARDTLTALFPTTDSIWLPLLATKVGKAASGLLQAEDVDATFERAEHDYFSIPLYRAHLKFLTQGNLSSQRLGTDDRCDANSGFFSTNNVSGKCMAILANVTAHTTEGHLVWNDWRDWWQQMIDSSDISEKSERIQLLKLEYMKRITTPHSTNDETFQAYSNFVSVYLPPDQYESTLVHASKMRQPALAAWRNRERYQLSLDSPQAYHNHIMAEQRKRSKSNDSRLRDPSAIINLYERAIAQAAALRTNALLSTISPNDQTSSNDIQATEAWLSSFWGSYVSFLRQEDIRSAELELPALARAVRNVPSDGNLWLSYFRALEFHGQDADILEIYQFAITSGRLTAKAISDVAIAAVVPSYRLLRTEFDVDVFSGLIGMLEDAIQRCKDAGGDSRLKLELFLVHVLLHPSGEPASSYSDESLGAALGVWESATKFYKKHWNTWISFVEFLVSIARNIPRARKAFKEFQGAHLAVDYPEAIYDAWISFEERWGSARELEDAISRVHKLSDTLNEKRAKDAHRASNMADSVEPTPAISGENRGQTSKRKAEDEAGPELKKLKSEPSPPALKRDREKTSVFVSGLTSAATDSDLQNLFRDCGSIREIKISSVNSDHVATVEFFGRESVPPALTKDKKRMHGEEISVHQAWQSTLYVANFPEKYDDGNIRELFGKYGTVFDVRWPSKKFKLTRRFCYVQYASRAAAEASLVLDQFLLEPGLRLLVAISDPERKKERTDADADQREVHVGGLNRTVVREDLQGLFSKYGDVKDIRMTVDERGRSKGFAFVEFEDQTCAMAALAANNTELKKRRIAVTLSDPKAPTRKVPASGLARKADAALRSVHLSGLPDLTVEQEPLLQQAIEKLVDKVVRLSVINEKHEAIAELETPASASKLVLMESMLFQSCTVVFSEEITRQPKQVTTKAPVRKANVALLGAMPGAPSSSGPFIPRAAKALRGGRARPGLGYARDGDANSAGDVELEPANSTPSSPRGQDVFRKMLGSS